MSVALPWVWIVRFVDGIHRVELSVPVRLRRAILQNDVLLVKRIVKNNPSYLRNPDFSDKSNTSLHLAAIKGHIDVVKLLISFGHDSCTPVIDRTGYDAAPGISLNTDSSTALHLAAAHSNALCVDYLCRTFPHIINWRDKDGKTALMLAAQSANPAHAPSSTFHVPPTARPRTLSAGTATACEDTTTISTLISHNASVTCVDNAGNTALHHASAWGNLKAVRVLLSAGSPPLALNKANHTPLDYSITKQAAQYFQSIVSDLERRKMDDQQTKKLKLNTARAVASEENRPVGRMSPVSPVQTRAKDAFGSAASPSKATQGSVRLVVDSDTDDRAAGVDDGASSDIQLTAKKIGRSPTDEQPSVLIANSETT